MPVPPELSAAGLAASGQNVEELREDYISTRRINRMYKYQVILHNEQGAAFVEKCDTKKECQNFLDSFGDPENLTGKVLDDCGEIVAVKKRKRFHWN